MSNPTNTTVFLLDNFDSFTYNLVDELKSIGYELVVYRNNVNPQLIFDKMQACKNSVVLMLSPGPGNPKEAGCMLELIKMARGHFPIIGICLGHQAIVEAYGGNVGGSGEIVHGKASPIEHNEHQVFDGLSNPLFVARYHSLMATLVPDSLDVIAKVNDIPMAVVNDQEKVLGYQFHPESILTTYGSKLLRQSLTFLTESN
ncbi:aminodeoxychorismate/anthranilate synthase component II [Catenovulum sp. 2E275]|uniref:aminodeoxychorismate/anthranilate synthase component II n=1 Tax=Catenovulum sp. 2E275 TaxID=2980497 RepID=UPI0021D1FA3C|nr:aminodeoxychorismate/anthranilate synthase component II [Catenovulum sp. 2E275]MCU4674792.1 aminodeoxychorismate/anthranilate synthase component II [Catenovulum sp. 2E275]